MASADVNRLETRAARLTGLVSGARLRLISVALAAGLLLALCLALAWIVGGVLLDLVVPLPVTDVMLAPLTVPVVGTEKFDAVTPETDSLKVTV